MDRFSNAIERLILSRIKTKRVLHYALFMFLSLLAQTMVLNRFRILGICPLVLPAVAVAVGMFEGATWGAVFALVIGFALVSACAVAIVVVILKMKKTQD